MHEFTKSDIVKILGIKPSRIQDWLERGFISPTIERASGTGTKNIYDRQDLYEIFLFKRLVESGIARRRVASAFEISLIKAFSVNHQVFLIFNTQGQATTYLCEGDKANSRGSLLNKGTFERKPLEELLKDIFGKTDDPAVFVVDFNKIVREVDQLIEKHK